MEAPRAIVAFTVAACILLAFSPPALAYDNGDAHLAINQYAIYHLKNNTMPGDTYLKNSSFAGTPVTGVAWDPQDGGTLRDVRAVKRTKTMEQWIVDGGYSADEPEVPMALRHFFDPVRIPSYLTDIVNDFYGGDYYVNPKMDARTWAISNATDNLYSFERGKSYLANALKSDENSNEDYASAWRSVGESMHLMADMTVPAHVRNDAHPPGVNSDPYESLVHWDSVKSFSRSDPSRGIQYDCTYGDQTVSGLMYDVAFWTNANFFSAETIPAGNVSKNGQLYYPGPLITGQPDAEGYYYHTVDGKRVPAARNTTMAKLGLTKSEKYYLDFWVLYHQEMCLIPTAIRADEAVLDAFLPRFYVTVADVSRDDTADGYMIVTGRIDHVPTNEWKDRLVVNNGAHVLVNGVDSEVLTSSYMPGMNMFAETFRAKPGDKIQVFYDMGGYRVYSEKYVVPARPVSPDGGAATNNVTVTPTPEPSPAVTPRNITTINATATPVPSGPRSVFGTPNWEVDHLSVKVTNEGPAIQVFAYIVDPSESRQTIVSANNTRYVSTPGYTGTVTVVRFGFFAYEDGLLIDSVEGTVEIHGDDGDFLPTFTPTPLPPTPTPTPIVPTPVPTALPEPQSSTFSGYLVDTTLDGYEYHYGLYSPSRNDAYVEFSYYDLYDYPQLEPLLKGNHAYVLDSGGRLRKVVINGPYRQREKGVLTMDYQYDLGAPTGLCKDYNKSTGIIEFETNYKNGLYNGLRKSYENGYILREMTYVNSMPEGPFKEYYHVTDVHPTPGRVSAEGGYKNYRKVGSYKEFFYGGNTRLACSFVYVAGSSLDTLDGSYITYYENGQPEQVMTYRNGMLQGAGYYYHTDGSKIYDHVYINGKYDGIQRKYYFIPAIQSWKGKPEYDEKYANGVFQYRDIYQYDESGALTGTRRVYDEYQY